MALANKNVVPDPRHAWTYFRLLVSFMVDACLTMYSCCICGESVQSLKAYVVHCKLHRNEPRCIFKCVGIDCKQVFSGYASLKSHFYRHHNGTSSVAQDMALETLKCAVSLCERQCDGVKELVAHLKEHIAEGRLVKCPVRGCKSVFTVKSSFPSHLSRKHRHCSVNMILRLI